MEERSRINNPWSKIPTKTFSPNQIQVSGKGNDYLEGIPGRKNQEDFDFRGL